MRYFVTFRKEASLHDKVMVFNNLTRVQVNELMAHYYMLAYRNIHDEPEFAAIHRELYEQRSSWVAFGTPCKVFNTNLKSNAPSNTIAAQYFFDSKEHDVAGSILDWFKTAKPTPVTKDLPTQMGAMFEEMAESIHALKTVEMTDELKEQVLKAHTELSSLSQMLYATQALSLGKSQSIELLDALADIAVTATGTAYFMKADWMGALREVNRSNWSKFENGKPILNENGKIMKGEDYSPPSLEEYV